MLNYNVGGKKYYSMVPFSIEGKLSTAVFKFRFVPVFADKFVNWEVTDIIKEILESSENDTVKKNKIIEICKTQTANLLGNRFRSNLLSNNMEWDFEIQFSTDPSSEPINDAKRT